MSVKTKDELLNTIKGILGEAPSDEGIALLEDISDTLDNSTGSSSDEDKKKIEELEKQVKDTDEMWRKRYTDRFLNPPENKDKPEEDDFDDDKVEEDDSPKTFEDLFTVVE